MIRSGGNGMEYWLNRFYEEVEQEESFDLGEIACILVPKLDYEIEKLRKEIALLQGKLKAYE